MKNKSVKQSSIQVNTNNDGLKEPSRVAETLIMFFHRSRENNNNHNQLNHHTVNRAQL